MSRPSDIVRFDSVKEWAEQGPGRECDPRFRPLESPSSCVCARDATDIAPNAGFDFWNNPRFAVLGAEGDVIMKRCVGVRHGNLLFSRRYATSIQWYANPALKGRAKFIGRYATVLHAFAQP